MYWWRSRKRGEGRVRYVCRVQVEEGGVRGARRGRVRRRVGWRPVGEGKVVR